MRTPGDDVGEFLYRIAPFVSSDGARNLNKISRELSLPYQTLRFRMMRLKEQGISILPIVNPGRLGLERIRLSFTLSRDIPDPYVLFGGLHQKAGLHYFARSMLSQSFDSEFMIPKGSGPALLKLLMALEEMKMVENVSTERILWKEILMMKTKLYDYEEANWDVDFSKLSGDPSIGIPSLPDDDSYDRTDILIIKEIQMDPWIKVVDLASKFGMSEGDAAYHLNKHVFGRSQVPSFRFKWVGTREAWSKHTIVGMTLFFRAISDDLSRRAMSVMTSTPFTWSHMRGEAGSYLSELLVPVGYFPETLHYISENLRPLGIRPEVQLIDYSCVGNYTIPHEMYDKESGWKLDAEKSLGYVLQMIKTYSGQ